MKRVVKKGRDANWKKDRDEKEAYSNIVLDFFFADVEGFCRFTRMNYKQFIELTMMITPVSKWTK